MMVKFGEMKIALVIMLNKPPFRLLYSDSEVVARPLKAETVPSISLMLLKSCHTLINAKTAEEASAAFFPL